MTLEIGKTYLVKSDRKGNFMGKCTGCDSTWAEFEITAGKAKAMLEYNKKEKGEKVTVRQSFCTFTEQPESATA